LTSNNNNIAPLLLEKAYVKWVETFYNINEKETKEKAADILYNLTSFVCKKLRTKYKDPEKLNRELKKYKDFKIRIAYPNAETCESHKNKLHPTNPYILQDIYKCEKKPVFVFKTLLGANKILPTKW
jgi:hypothetical protein